MSEKIPIKEILAAIDLSAKSLWDDIDDDQRKSLKNEFWILNRYISNVNDKRYQSHFIEMVNECYNKNYVEISKHPKLQWLLLCLCSYDKKTIFQHNWLGMTKKKKSNKRFNLLSSIYPTLKQDEIDLLLEINTDDEIRELAREVGWSEKEAKDL